MGMRVLLMIFLVTFSHALVANEVLLRVAMLNADFSRDGPGLLIKDIIEEDESLLPTINALQNLDADILLLTDIDQDDQAWAASELAQILGYTYHYQGPTNRGIQTGYDIDRDGWIDENDTIGYGEFRGHHGMTIFSKNPITNPLTFTKVTWSEVEGVIRPENYFSDEEWESIPLSTSGIWVVEINGVQFIASYAATPAFDGEEDRNGLRNMAENLWLDQFLRGKAMADDLGVSQTLAQPFVAIGTLNLDPNDGDGHRQTMANLLANPKLRDYGPSGPLGLATADWRDKGYGALRVDYILPSCEFEHIEGGMEPIENNAHFLIWLDLKPTTNCK